MHNLEEQRNRSNNISQLCGMLKRQFTIKFRDRRRSIAEILLPLYSLGLLILLKLSVPNPNFGPENSDSKQFSFVEDLHFLKKYDKLAIIPNSMETKDFASLMNDLYIKYASKSHKNLSKELHFQFFNSSDQLIEYYYQHPKDISYAIVFDVINSSMSYKIRANPSLHTNPPTSIFYSSPSDCRHQESQIEEAFKDLPFSKAMKSKNNTNNPFKPDPSLCPADEYIQSGFVALQFLVDATFLHKQYSDGFKIPNLKFQRFPKGAYTGGWLLGLRVVIPIYIVMSLSQFMTYLIINIVGEKESKLKEGMKIMGLRDPAYWFSWFFVYGCLVTFHSTLSIVLLTWLQVFQHTNMFILYLLLMSYSFSLIMFSFFLTPFFDKASSAGLVASFVVNIVSLLYFLQIFLSKAPTILFWIISLLSSAGFALAMDTALIMELSGEGVQWSNLWKSSHQVGLSFGSSLLMMFIDILLYGLFAYYLDNVLPSQYGTRKPLTFFLKSSFWNKNKIKKRKYVSSTSNINESFLDDNETACTFRPIKIKENNAQGMILIENQMERDKMKENSNNFNNVCQNEINNVNNEIHVENKNNLKTHKQNYESSYKVYDNYSLPNYGIIKTKEQINLNNNFDIEIAVKNLNDEPNKFRNEPKDNAIKMEDESHIENNICGTHGNMKQQMTENESQLEKNTSGNEVQSINVIITPNDKLLAPDERYKEEPMNGNIVTNNSASKSNFNDIEKVSRHLIGREAIEIKNLTKSFSGCKQATTTALENINLTLYEGQITAILGHNGAGKTTLFNILTGLTTPTSGTAFIYGYDVSDPDGMSMIRQMIGVCPQSDLLFEVLTPKEHLEFYSSLKGIPKSKRDEEIKRTLKDVDLEEKETVLSKYLSGGQKRKLSVAIAILGDPKIIILDEPTAGIDPYSRRHLWSIFQKKRTGRVILLTTHFMDEADILADRKAVISKGQIRCCGSSLFLKNKFGIGYHLTLVLDTVSHEEAIARLIFQHISKAERTRRHGKELSYILPYDSVHMFASLFSAIEDEIQNTKNRLGISSYGISMTSLEEVFLQLEKDEEEQGKNVAIENISKTIVENKNRKLRKTKKQYTTLENEINNDASLCTTEADCKLEDSKSALGIGHDPVSIERSTCRIFFAITKLRLIRLFRDLQKLYIMICIPLIFASIGMYMHKGSIDVFTQKELPLSQYEYKDSYTLAINIDNSEQSSQFLQCFANNTFLLYDGNYTSLLHYNKTTPLIGALNLNGVDNITIIYNDTCVHALPIILNTIDNVFYKYLSKAPISHSKTENYKKPILTTKSRKTYQLMAQGNYTHISTKVDPLPLTQMTPGFNSGLFSMSLFLGMVFVLIPVNMSVELVQDRENKSKNQLRVNGLSCVIYFLSHFLILIALIIFVYIGLMVLIYFFVVSFLKDKVSFVVMSCLIIITTPSLILFCTCLSYLFNKSNSARSIMPNIVTGFAFIPFIMVSCSHMYNIEHGSYHFLHQLFCLFDTIYIPYSIIYFMDIIHINCELSNNCHTLTFLSYINNQDIQTIILSALVQIPVLFCILIYLDIKKSGSKHFDIIKQLFNRNKLITNYEKTCMIDDLTTDDHDHIDEDVISEKNKVNNIVNCNMVYNQPAVLVQNLNKIYKKGKEKDTKDGLKSKEKLAVKNLSLCIEEGEVFGLLGHNGAGKTTTLKIITYEEMPTSGRIHIGGYNIVSNFGLVFELLGYCPQHNALWHNITLREHLETYAAIRGVKKYDIPRLVNSFIHGLHIEEHADKQVYQCSGGTKRKLSFALAMIGNPKIVLLDEPSTGMDPKSKRFLWDTILASFKGSRGAILTTHSMEEADALCSRVGIMVQGELKCIGSTQHLKNRYGAGYTLEIKLHLSNQANNTNKIDDIKCLVKTMFHDACVEEEFIDRLVFSVPQSCVTSLANTFLHLEKAKKDFEIEEYSFSQTTLEQVYLKFAQSQKNEQQLADEF